MRIIDGIDGGMQSIPFTLGEKGRGRWLVNVEVHNRYTNLTPEIVGYQVVNEGLVLLTAPQAQQVGTLVRLNCNGGYRRNTSGHTKLKFGDAICLACGHYAWGDAGRIGGADDELWHVRSDEACFSVLVSATGSWQYFLLLPDGRHMLLTLDKLLQELVRRGDGILCEVMERHASSFGDKISNALQLGHQMEDHPVEAPKRDHYVTAGASLEKILADDFGIEIHPDLKPLTTGVSGIKAKTLQPGDKSLVILSAYSGGGARYRIGKSWMRGLTIVCPNVCSRADQSRLMVALIEDPDRWAYGYEKWKDGKLMSYEVKDGWGIRCFDAEEPHEAFYFRAWEGFPLDEQTVWDDVKSLFDLELVQ